MSSQSASTYGGISFTGMLQILFIGLKLTGYINWHWWQVFLPTIIPLGLVALILIRWLIVVLIGQVNR